MELIDQEPQTAEVELSGFERCAAGLADAVNGLKSRQNRDSAQAAFEASEKMVKDGQQSLIQVRFRPPCI